MDWLSFRCSILTLRFSSDFPELWESGLGRALTTAIPITDTDIIPTGITTGHILTIGITEARHTTGLTGIECITATTIIIIAIGGTKGTKGTRTNNNALNVAVVRVSHEDRLPAGINR